MTRHTPRVTIGMPVYNGEKFLKEAIDSIMAQSFEDFELIISDNASTDRTQEICRACMARDKRIRYVRNEANIGVNRNFNRVFQLCSGEYFKWATADDVCHRNLVARCLEVLDGNQNAVLAYPKTRFIDETGRLLDWNDPGWDLRSDDALERMRYVIYSGHWVNAFYGLTRVQSLAKTRLFASYRSGDYRLLGELSLMGKFIEVSEHLFFRRIHAGASSQNTDPQWQSHFFAGDVGYISLPLWRLCLDHSATVIHSKLSVSQKLSLVAFILDRMVSGKRQLLKELKVAFKYYIAKIPRSL
jgi:glycosyltransferase involved in cell wall biosynthesis